MPVYDHRYCDDTDYQIGLTPQTMVSLRRLRLGVPDQPVFTAARLYYVRGDQSRVGDGFPTANWIWDISSVPRVYVLSEYLQGEDSNVVYIRTDRRNTGDYPNPRSSFAVFEAVMWKPIMSGQEGVPVARSPYALQTVNFQFKRLIEQPGYL